LEYLNLNVLDLLFSLKLQRFLYGSARRMTATDIL